MISAFADMIGYDGAAVFQVDCVSRGRGKPEQRYKGQLSYKEDGDA
jgi:hypothetical protein